MVVRVLQALGLLALAVLVQVGLLATLVLLVRQVSPEAPVLPVALGLLVLQVVAVLLAVALLARRDTMQMEARADRAIRGEGTNRTRTPVTEETRRGKAKMTRMPKPFDIMLTLIVIAVLIYLGWATIGEWK